MNRRQGALKKSQWMRKTNDDGDDDDDDFAKMMSVIYS